MDEFLLIIYLIQKIYFTDVYKFMIKLASNSFIKIT